MNFDNVVEAFVSTIIIVVMLVVLVTILNQDVGLFLVGIIPSFVEMLVWLLVMAIIGSLLFQLVDET